jgi:hypothetical protein
MRNFKPNFKSRRLHKAFGLALASLLCLAPASQTARAQSGGIIEAGTTIAVRTNEEIVATASDGRVFTGSVDQDVRDTRGQVAIPRGSYVELLVKRSPANEYVLDIESVEVSGRRLGVDSVTSVRAEKEGLGINDRTGKYVGGGAIIGAIIGALADGGKGAAIGGAAGAAAGAGAQVLTRGKHVTVPAESLVTFRLEQSLRTTPDTGFSRNGTHYHSGYGTAVGNTAGYEAGLKTGRADKRSNRPFNAQTPSFRGKELSEYQEGYERGYDETVPRAGRGGGTGEIQIGADRYITWKGPAAAKVYVQVDNNPKQLFSPDGSGHQPAPWITRGHKYVFTLEGPNGREIARDENDLRQRRTFR